MGQPRAPYRIAYRDQLTPRQQEVLALIARGRTNAQIAETLGVGFETVKTHVAEILGKLGVDSREDAAALYTEQSSFRYRAVRAARALAAAVFSKAGLIAGGVVVLIAAAAMVSVLLARSNDDQVASPTVVLATPTAVASATGSPPPTTTPAPTGIPTPVTPVAIPSVVNGKPVKELVEGPPVPFPDNVVLYLGVSECANCGFGLGALRRIYRNDAGELIVDRPTPPGTEQTAYISAYWQDDYEMYVGFCTGYCGGEGFPSDDGVVTVMHSLDGGITWSAVGSPIPRSELSFVGMYLGEMLTRVTHYLPSNQIEKFEIISLPSMTVGQPPAALPAVTASGFPYAWPVLAPGGQLLWANYESDTTRYFDSLGLLAPLSRELDALQPGADWVERKGEVWQAVYAAADPDSPSFYVYVDEQGRPSAGFTSSVEVWRFGARIDDHRWIGSAVLPLAPGEESVGGNDNFRAVLIDTEAGTMSPILGLPRDASPLDGNFSWPYTAVAGQFVRIVSNDGCVDVRASVSASAASVGCYADGVLLHRRSGDDLPGWYAILTMDGDAGFVPVAAAQP